VLYIAFSAWSDDRAGHPVSELAPFLCSTKSIWPKLARSDVKTCARAADEEYRDSWLCKAAMSQGFALPANGCVAAMGSTRHRELKVFSTLTCRRADTGHFEN